jgi:hypothetical protein
LVLQLVAMASFRFLPLLRGNLCHRIINRTTTGKSVTYGFRYQEASQAYGEEEA